MTKPSTSDRAGLGKALLNGEAVEAKMVQVINRLLLLATRERTLGTREFVSWTVEKSDVFTAKAGGYTLRLSKNQQTYKLKIIGVNDEVVEEATTVAGSGDPYKNLFELHAQVRRQAMRSEEALERILKYMES